MSEESFDVESVDLTQPIYAESPESQVQPTSGTDYEETEIQAQDYDLFAVLHRLETKVDEQATKLAALTEGVNTIGEMMNSVAEVFDQMMKKIQSGGIAGVLGGLMGGKNGD